MPIRAMNKQEEKGFNSCKKEDDSIPSPPPWLQGIGHLSLPSAPGKAGITLQALPGEMRRGRTRDEEPRTHLFPFLTMTQKSGTSPDAAERCQDHACTAGLGWDTRVSPSSAAPL